MLVDLINDYGFPIVATVGMGYFVFYIYKWVTHVIKPLVAQAQNTLIGLIDRVRMLDNDMIRLTQKIEMIIEFKEEYEKLTGKKIAIEVDDIETKIKGKDNVAKDTVVDNTKAKK